MGDKSRTEHTKNVEVEMAPDYMKPYTDIDDLNSDVFLEHGEASGSGFSISDPDASKNGIVKKLLENGDIVSEESTRELLIKRYDEYYEQNSAEPSTTINKWTENAQKALSKLQKEEEKQAESEARPMQEFLTTKEYENQFIEDYLENQRITRREQAANYALIAASGEYLDDLTNAQLSYAAKDEQKKAQDQCRMNDVLKYLAATQFEYLTRGATLTCSCGAVWRKLNLPLSHGVYYGENKDPVINKKDCEVGDNYNITNFGHCSGFNPPPQRDTLNDLVSSDEKGRHLEAQDSDAVDRGYKCIPQIVLPGWQNTYKKTQIGGSEIDAVSTQSFLVCVHGGIIYPINSGQHSNLVALMEEDAELNSTFDKLCTQYRELKYKQNKMIMDGITSESEIEELEEVSQEMEEAGKKMESCMDRARGDGYQKGYEDIPAERRDTIEHMLQVQAELREGEAASLKSDYYSYKRRNGYTSDSAYGNDNADFKIGSDEYTDWRAGRLENKSKKEARKEFIAWESDVDSRGYEHLSSFEKEEYDKADKIYGK